MSARGACAVVAATLALACAAAPPADAGERRLLVLGDSLAFDSWQYIRRAVPHWRLVGNIGFARRTGEGAPILRSYGRRLPGAVHVSLGTADDPAALDELHAQVRAVLRAVGPRRCVIWANVWRPVAEGPGFDGFNAMLADEAAARANVRIIDWHSMVAAHPEWLKRDEIHVDADGNRARARAVRRKLRACWAQRAA